MTTRRHDASGHPWRYPGVQAFGDTPAARRLFFGREEEASNLLYQLLADRFVIAFGRSGHGKSSLIRAGLMESLRAEGYFPFIARVDAVKNDPGGSIIAALADEVEARGVPYRPGHTESLWHFFKTTEVGPEDDPLRLVLILDQFEELFTLTAAKGRKRFADELADVVRGSRPRDIDDDHLELSDRPPDVKILVSMRGDYLWEFESLPRGLPEVFRSRFRVDPLRTRDARAAITGPSNAPGEWATEPFEWTEPAVDAMLEILGRKQDETDNRTVVEPFLLQVVCRQVEDQIARARIESPIQLDEIGADGSIEAMLVRYYEDCIKAVAADAPDDERRRRQLDARRLCEEWLISPGKQRLSLRREQIYQDVGLLEDDLETLARTRLLTRDTRTGGNYFEISHDSLVDPILASRTERLRLAQLQRQKRLRVGAAIAAAAALLFFVTFVDEWRDRGLLDAVIADLGEEHPALGVAVLNDVVNYDGRGLFDSPDEWNLAVEEVFAGLPWDRVSTSSPSYALVSADGDFLVTASGLGVEAYDLSSRDGAAVAGPGLDPDWRVSGGDTIRVPRVIVARGDGTFGVGYESGHAVLWTPGAPDSLRVTELPRHDRAVRDLVFGDDPSRVVTSDEGGTVRLAQTSGTGVAALMEPLSPVEGEGAYHLSTSGDRLAIGTRQGRVVLLELTPDWSEVRSIPFDQAQNDDRVEALEFDAAGRTLFARFRRTPSWLIDVEVAVNGGVDDSYLPDERLGVLPSSAASESLLAVMTEADTLLVIPSPWIVDSTTFRVEHAEGTGAGFIALDRGMPPGRFPLASARSNGGIRLWTMEEDAERSTYVDIRGGSSSGVFLPEAGPDGGALFFTYSADGVGDFWHLGEMALLLGGAENESRDDRNARVDRLKRVIDRQAGGRCLDDDVAGEIQAAHTDHAVQLGFFHERFDWLVSLKRKLPPRDPLDFCRSGSRSLDSAR